MKVHFANGAFYKSKKKAKKHLVDRQVVTSHPVVSGNKDGLKLGQIVLLNIGFTNDLFQVQALQHKEGENAQLILSPIVVID